MKSSNNGRDRVPMAISSHQMKFPVLGLGCIALTCSELSCENTQAAQVIFRTIAC